MNIKFGSDQPRPVGEFPPHPDGNNDVGLAALLGGAIPLSSLMARPAAPPPLSVDEQLNMITAGETRFNHAPRWQVGALVTPRTGYGTNAVGKPMTIIETAYDKPLVSLDEEHVGSEVYGARHDVRVLFVGSNNEITAVWVQGWVLRKWTPADYDKAKADEAR